MNFLRISYSDVSDFKGNLIYLHDGKDIGSGAFEKNKTAEIRILLPRSVGVVSVYAIIYSEDMKVVSKILAKLVSNDVKNDEYSIELNSFPIGLYFFSLSIDSVAGEFFGVKGIGREIVFSQKDSSEHFQFSIVDFASTSSDAYRGGMIYHIFVDRFNRGGNVTKRSDAVLYDEWEDAIPEYPSYPGAHLENNTFFGGTLYGVIDKLDYISNLGVSLIYLSPIFEAYSNHKYDTGDYMKVDAMFGGEEALKQLIQAAEKKGIGIILDGVFNHTGSDSVYFNRYGRYKELGAYQSDKSPYYSWYDFQHHPDKYTSWWGLEILPRINPDIAQCGNYIAGDGGVIEKYSDLGVAGFRLDVADELSDKFISKIKSKLEERGKPSILYGEVWEDASNKIAYDKRKRYYLGEELDGVMNYPLRTGIISFLRDKKDSALRYALLEVLFNAPKRIRDLEMNILGTHDTERIITTLSGKSSEGRSNDELSTLCLSEEEKSLGIKLVKMAYSILFTVPGLPTVFYGDEVGLEGYHDPFNRRPFPWKNGDFALAEFVSELGKYRRDNSVYIDGEFDVIHLDPKILVFSRRKGNVACYTLVNNSEDPVLFEFSSIGESYNLSISSKRFMLKPLSSDIIKTSSNSNVSINKI